MTRTVWWWWRLFAWVVLVALMVAGFVRLDSQVRRNGRLAQENRELIERNARLVRENHDLITERLP